MNTLSLKKLALLVLLSSTAVSAYACSFPQTSFCSTLNIFSERVVVTGQIVQVDETGIDFAIIEVLRGEELRDTIRIWDGTDFDCNGLWSLAAAYIGELGDTMILILPKIEDTENEWDVIGDYRRGDPYYYETELKVNGGTVRGFIRGLSDAPSTHNIWTAPYQDLKNDILNGENCSTLVSTNTIATSKPSIKVNNPFSASLTIQLVDTKDAAMLRIYAISGYLVYEEKINGQNVLEIDASMLQTGVYILELNYDTNAKHLLKLVKI